ncbi:hypothetical protein F4695_004012 [Rhizobium soli]|uniref:Uncharacterized protein n=1 Tax=Rhizobium soli TaxID=424798 RepID=A0A7X0JN17_9HYPH|nr:hypothetical protein [Rhizobium soli]
MGVPRNTAFVRTFSKIIRRLSLSNTRPKSPLDEGV